MSIGIDPNGLTASPDKINLPSVSITLATKLTSRTGGVKTTILFSLDRGNDLEFVVNGKKAGKVVPLEQFIDTKWTTVQIVVQIDGSNTNPRVASFWVTMVATPHGAPNEFNTAHALIEV